MLLHAYCKTIFHVYCKVFSPPGTHFTAESTESMQIKYLAQRNNILLPGFEPSTSVARNRHSNQTTNML